MITTVSFALARYGRRLRRQQADLIRFSDEGLALMKGGKALQSFVWEEVDKLGFIGSQQVAPRMFQLFGGSLFQQREGRFILLAGDFEAEYLLEMDAEFRKGEMLKLFKELYAKGIPLEERSALGGRLYLGKTPNSQSEN